MKRTTELPVSSHRLLQNFRTLLWFRTLALTIWISAIRSIRTFFTMGSRYSLIFTQTSSILDITGSVVLWVIDSKWIANTFCCKKGYKYFLWNLLWHFSKSVKGIVRWIQYYNTFAVWEPPMCIDTRVACSPSYLWSSTRSLAFFMGMLNRTIRVSPVCSIALHLVLRHILSAKVLMTRWGWFFVCDIIANHTLFIAALSTF